MRKSTHFDYILISWLTLFVLFLCCQLPLRGEIRNQDELRTHLEQLQHHPTDWEQLRDISFYYLHVADYPMAIEYGERLFDLGYKTHDYQHSVIYSHICLGQASLMMGGKADFVLNNLLQAREIGLVYHLDSALCSVYNGLGLFALNRTKDYYQALHNFFLGVDAAKRSRNQQMYTLLMTNIVATYYIKKDTTGLKYALECYELGHQQEDPFLIFSAATITAYLLHLGHHDQKALAYIQEAESIMHQEHFLDQSNVYSIMGSIYHRLGREKEAREAFETSLQCKDSSSTSSILNTYLCYAEFLHDRKNYSEAIRLLKEGLELSFSQESQVYRTDILEALSRCYEDSGEIREALNFHKLYSKETYSLFDGEKERAVNEMRAKYDLERHENKIKQLQIDLLHKEYMTNLLGALVMGVVLIAILLYVMYRRKQKLYLAIVRQNQEAIQREEALKYASSSLSDEKKQDLFQRIETLMTEERLYSDALLTKDKVAERLDTNRTYLSQIINEQTGKSFTQWVNSYRIREAVRILSDSSDHTPLKALASELGFNSMTTFYNQFQSVTGMPPAQYRRKVEELHKSGQ